MLRRTRSEVEEIVRAESVIVESHLTRKLLALDITVQGKLTRINEDLDTLDDDLSMVQQLRDEVEELSVNLDAYRIAAVAVGEVAQVLFDRLMVVERKAEATLYQQTTLIRDLRNNGQPV